MAIGNPGDVCTFVDSVGTQAGVIIAKNAAGTQNTVAYHFMGYPNRDHQKAAKEFTTTSVTVVSTEAN